MTDEPAVWINYRLANNETLLVKLEQNKLTESQTAANSPADSTTLLNR